MKKTKIRSCLFSLLSVTLLAGCSHAKTSSLVPDSSGHTSLPTSSDPASSTDKPSTSDKTSSSQGEETKPYEEHKVSPTGAQKGLQGYGGKYYTDFATLDDERVAAKKKNIEVSSEGDVLLKNDGVLPLKASEKRVTLFGYRTANIMMGGGGSGSGRPGEYGVPKTTLEEGMTEAGFEVNKKMFNYYANLSSEIDPDRYPESITSSYSSYSDAAIVMFSRYGSEGADERTQGVDGDKHYLEFTDVEKKIIRHAKAHFSKVILLVNSSNAMELGEVNEKKTADNLGVDAILWVGHVGNDGAAAIGKILNGEVTPSGHTADTYARDFTKDPTFANFGSNAQNKDSEGNALDNNLYRQDGTKTDYRAIEYREGIYLGYRYYETKGHIAGEDWYKNNVVYPFGYGLSYTTFDWKITDDIRREHTISDARETVTVKVNVTNTGSTAGKDVVQLYYSAPYTDGGIEKSYVNLAAFAKTKLLEPGESQVLTLSFVAQDMASFDYNDANENNFRGYELEAGEYSISLRRNAHEEVDSIKRTIAEDMKIDTDYTTGHKIEPLFSNGDKYETTNAALNENLMTRANGLELPKASSKKDRTVSDVLIQELDDQKTFYAYQDKSTDPWYVSKVPSAWNQNEGERVNGKTAIQLRDLVGVNYTEPTLKNGVVTAANDEGTKKWDTFLNQMTYRELAQLISYGGFGTPAMESIGKNYTGAYDAAAHPFWNAAYSFGGASYPQNQMGTNWCTPAVWATTWNVDLLQDIGTLTGNEALFFNTEALYGFSFNIHRSAFGGRNFEYLSEDGLLTGKLAGALCHGASSKGLITYTKHFMLNNQETNRNENGGYITYTTEQAIREIYGKGYELAVKEGNNTGFMTAFNRIGKQTCSTNYNLMEKLARGEWGFNGIAITDYMDYADYRSTELMARTGNELPLANINHSIGKGKGGVCHTVEGTWDASKKTVLVAANKTNAKAADTARVSDDEATASGLETLASPTQWYNVRKAAQRVLYSYANGIGVKNGNEYHKTTTLKLSLNKSLRGFFNPGKAITSFLLPLFKEGDDLTNAEYISGNLPEGVSFDSTGTLLVGTPTKAGTYPTTFAIRKDGWCYIEITVNMVVA